MREQFWIKQDELLLPLVDLSAEPSRNIDRVVE